MSASQFVPKNLLIVGATGWLGSQITTEILKNKSFHVKVLARKETQEKKKDLIENFKSHGAVIVDGDLNNVDSLVSALQNVDTVVSVIGSAQIAEQFPLIEAAKKVPSVKRFVPSEYGVDTSNLSSDSLLYGKAQVRKAIEEAGLEYTYIITGFFYEFFTSPAFGFDHEKGELHLGGTGDEVFIATHTSDIAKFLPEILLDPRSRNENIVIQGERVTLNQVVKTFGQVSGKHFEVTYYSLDQLKKQIDEAEGFAKFLPYLKSLVFTQSVNPPKNHSSRYSVIPISVKQYAESLHKKQ